MSSLGPRPLATTSAVTLAPSSVGLPIFTSSPSAIRSTSPNVTAPPASIALPSCSSFSTWIVSPGWTRYCLPPVAITAYMNQLLGETEGRSLRVSIPASTVFCSLDQLHQHRAHDAGELDSHAVQRTGRLLEPHHLAAHVHRQILVGDEHLEVDHGADRERVLGAHEQPAGREVGHQVALQLAAVQVRDPQRDRDALLFTLLAHRTD